MPRLSARFAVRDSAWSGQARVALHRAPPRSSPESERSFARPNTAGHPSSVGEPSRAPEPHRAAKQALTWAQRPVSGTCPWHPHRAELGKAPPQL